MDKEKKLMDLEFDLINDFINLRKEKGITQQQLADESGTLREMISVIEKGKKHPQINTLIKLLEPFGYTLGIKKIGVKDGN